MSVGRPGRAWALKKPWAHRIHVLLTTCVFTLVASSAWGADDYQRLLKTLERDSSYKVRLQALQIIKKKILKSKKSAPESVLKGVGRSALEDDNKIVRGFACVMLGQLKDARARDFLTKAQKDSDPFVRVQARDALARLPKGGATSNQARWIVVDVQDTPGVTTPKGVTSNLQRLLEDGFRSRATGWKVVPKTTGNGFRMTGTISRLEFRPTDDGRNRVTMEVGLTVATWPDNNLRHVMKASASATARLSAKSRDRLLTKLLQAAVDKAVADAVAEIGGT